MTKPMRIFIGSRVESIRAIEKAGEISCRYSGAAWPHFCDCKYGGPRERLGKLGNSEQTGCPELMSAHAILSAMTDAEWVALAAQSGGYTE
jgi:hypothetical protein